MWKVRHQGSPSALGDLTLPQVAEGLADGRWEPTDEVMGPNDDSWIPIEIHPQLEAIAAELEPPPPRHYDDETRLDMNALIDVCLVLLIFFILTTSYAVLQKRMEAAGVSKADVGPAVLTKEQVDQQMISLSARMEGDTPVIQVEKQPVDLDNLASELRKFVKQTKKTQLLMEIDREVPHRIKIEVQDAARTAGMEKISEVRTDKGKR